MYNWTQTEIIEAKFQQELLRGFGQKGILPHS